jgi:hypothetical protein
MENSATFRSYKFNFWKDGFGLWAFVLPFGLIGWAIPFVLFIGLMNASNSPDWFPYFVSIVLGIPAYLVGWIFVYSLMEGIYTKVTFTEEWVSVRLPWLIFPVIPVVKKINLDQILKIDAYAHYGSRIAVYLYYLKGNKERRFYLPKFKNSPGYGEEILAIQKKLEQVL